MLGYLQTARIMFPAKLFAFFSPLPSFIIVKLADFALKIFFPVMSNFFNHLLSNLRIPVLLDFALFVVEKF